MIPNTEKLFFVGPPWLIAKVKEVFGDTINYYEQKPLPKK